MGLFDFLKKKKTETPKPPVSKPANKNDLTGADFEFLITGVSTIPPADFDRIMTPNSVDWEKVIRDGWPYYKVDEGEFSYSWEEPGIQMTFSKGFVYVKAKTFADEIIQNLREAGQEAELITLDKNQLYRLV